MLKQSSLRQDPKSTKKGNLSSQESQGDSTPSRVKNMSKNFKDKKRSIMMGNSGIHEEKSMSEIEEQEDSVPESDKQFRSYSK
jgi:hypothetical protein